MNSFDALRWLIESGARISRREWGDVEYYGCILNGQLMLHKPDGKYYSWILSEGDISGRDWMLVGDLINA